MASVTHHTAQEETINNVILGGVRTFARLFEPFAVNCDDDDDEASYSAEDASASADLSAASDGEQTPRLSSSESTYSSSLAQPEAVDWSLILDDNSVPFEADLSSLPFSRECDPECLFVTKLAVRGFVDAEAGDGNPIWEKQTEMLKDQLKAMDEVEHMNVDVLALGETQAGEAAVPSVASVDESKSPRFEYEPSVEAFIDMIMGNLSDIVGAADKIPLIDVDVTGNQDLLSRYLASVDISDPTVMVHKAAIEATMRDNFRGPEELLESLSPYLEYVELYRNRDAFREAVRMMEPSLSQYERIVETQYARADTIEMTVPNMARFGMFAIDLTPAKTALVSMSRSLALSVLDLLHKEAKEECNLIRVNFRMLNNELKAHPDTPEEWHAMVQTIASIDDTIAYERNKIKIMMAKYDKLEHFQYRIEENEVFMKWDAVRWPRRISEQLLESEVALKHAEEAFQQELAHKQKEFVLQLNKLQEQVVEAESYGSVDRAPHYLAAMRKLQKNLQESLDVAQTYNSHEELFGQEKTSYETLVEVTKAVAPYVRLWEIAANWTDKRDAWLEGEFVELKADEMQKTITEWISTLTMLENNFAEVPDPKHVARVVLKQIKEFQGHMPVITALLTVTHLRKDLQQKHWDRLAVATGQNFRPEPDTDLASILGNYSFDEFIVQLEEIAVDAKAEHEIDVTLDSLWRERQRMTFDVVAYRDSGTYILSSLEDIIQRNEEHILKIQSLRNSKYIGEFEKKMNTWKLEFERYCISCR